MFQFRVQIRSLAGVSALAFLFVAGCGTSVPKSTELKDLATVTGLVKFNNEPIPGAFVTFHPVDKPGTPPIASAIVESDGKFAVKSTVGRELKSGATPGAYRLSVSWLIPPQRRLTTKRPRKSFLRNIKSPKPRELKSRSNREPISSKRSC